MTLRGKSHDYQLVDQADDGSITERSSSTSSDSRDKHGPGSARLRRSTLTCVIPWLTGFLIVLVVVFSAAAGIFFGFRNGRRLATNSCLSCPCRPSKVPQYFQTCPELWAGPTPTGKAPFLAQTAVFNPAADYVPNAPLQTAIPIDGMTGSDETIFHMMGQLTPYAPSPGFGVREYPLPENAEIIQVQMLHRHGARYPTSNSSVEALARRIEAAKANGTFKTKGKLTFLNDWKYELGAEILVPKGRQELFDSGVLHAYMYGQLYNPNSNIIVRTTTQDRMLKSAENFLAGFFGLEWQNNATIEVIIEEAGFNNSLAGYLNCPNSNKYRPGSNMSHAWVTKYIQDATARLQDMTEGGFEWTVDDAYAAQTLCPYETVAYGSSRFCDLFTYQEWQNYGYSIDLSSYGNEAFGSPTGRAVGIGYQQEVIARLRNHTLGYSGSQINTTLDSSTETFPLNQTLYFDFSHDSNIIAILTAMGLTQFAHPLDSSPQLPIPVHNFTVAHMTPFAARLDMEIIRTPRPLRADRSGYDDEGPGETRYVHFVLNQRTLPLGWSFPECDAARVDGWCELGTFLRVQERMGALADFERACFWEEGGGVTRN